ncbi:hypothetical protein K1719_017791 [Acacia pycnantha]|nr:hypothetical protein K1719_017791 [Acacia pycnantha]
MEAFSHVSDITHHLLTEAFTDDMDQKQIGRWKSAVNTRINAGQRDLFAGLLFLQSPASSHFVRVASVASMSDFFFSRLDLSFNSFSPFFISVKKNGSSFAAKVVQPVLKLLNDDKRLYGKVHFICYVQ